jgi:hypothetical protein
MKRTPILNNPSAVAALVVSALAIPSAHAATVWNVNIGNEIGPGEGSEITTGDNYVGAATENTINSTWNAVQAVTSVTLKDSTGDNSAGVTFDLSDNVNFGNIATVGDEIFKSWVKDDNNSDPWTVTFGNLSTMQAYDIVVYSGWFWGPEAVPVNLIAGTGLSGTFFLNSPAMDGTALSTGLAQDTDSANVAGNFNYARFNGLTPDGSGNITLSFGISETDANDFAINGFQLVQVPELSTAFLGGLGLLALLRRRR